MYVIELMHGRLLEEDTLPAALETERILLKSELLSRQITKTESRREARNHELIIHVTTVTEYFLPKPYSCYFFSSGQPSTIHYFFIFIPP